MGFADDGALCFIGICPHTLIQIAQPFLDKAVEWGAQNGLTFSVDKTTAVFFTRKYNFHSKEINQVNKLTMNGVEMTPQDSMTYLGVVLDNKLNWNKHIQTKVSKCKKFLPMLRPAIKHHWGLSPIKVQWIWKQMILPRLTYGCHVWGHSLTKTQILSIKKVARLALVYYAPMWKSNSTPTPSLEIILNQKPPHIKIQGVVIKSYICIKDLVENTWDGNAFNKRSASHLQTLKNVTKTILHKGTAIKLFECEHTSGNLFIIGTHQLAA